MKDREMLSVKGLFEKLLLKLPCAQECLLTSLVTTRFSAVLICVLGILLVFTHYNRQCSGVMVILLIVALFSFSLLLYYSSFLACGKAALSSSPLPSHCGSWGKRANLPGKKNLDQSLPERRPYN